MKFFKIVIPCIIFIVLIVVAAQVSYRIGQQNASLTITPATPLQLAEAMQSDKFYSTYQQTMLLIQGTVQSVVQQGNGTIIEFTVAKAPTALGKVTCTINGQSGIREGDTIRMLTVAHDVLRKNSADVFMHYCYLLKS